MMDINVQLPCRGCHEGDALNVPPQEVAAARVGAEGAVTTAGLSGQLAEVRAELSTALQQLGSRERGAADAAVTQVRVADDACLLDWPRCGIVDDACNVYMPLKQSARCVDRGWSSCRPGWRM